MSSDQSPRHFTMHSLPNMAYPLTIEFYAPDDPMRAREPLRRLEIGEAGVIALPTLEELGRPAWLHVTYADGTTDDLWPPQLRDRNTEAALDLVRTKIATHGWMIQGVEDVNDNSGAEDMMFTVGLTERGRPELVMYGIPRYGAARDIAQHVINHLAALSIAEELEPGRAYPAALADGSNVTVVDKDVDKPLTAAWQMYSRNRVRHLVIEPVGENQA